MSNYSPYFVFCNLQHQDHISKLDWPTHASIALPKGWMMPGEDFYLVENTLSTAIPFQHEVVETWDNGSVKWLHLYATFKYRKGKNPPSYYLFKFPDSSTSIVQVVPYVPLKVHLEGSEDQIADGTTYSSATSIIIETDLINVSVKLPFEGVTVETSDGTSLISGNGGPYLVDDRMIEWHAMHDETAEMVVEQAGPTQATIKISGWYQNSQKRIAPFCRFVTRITAYANSDLVKFDHATIFADDMRKHGILEMGFKFPANATGYAAGVDEKIIYGDFNPDNKATWYAQLKHDSVLQAKTGAKEPRLPSFTEKGTHCDGWFNLKTVHGNVALLTKDTWQKCPKEVKIAEDGMTYYTWPKHNELNPPTPDDLELSNIYKFPCFHKGQILESKVPSEYFTALSYPDKQSDTNECKPQYARAANMQGIAIRNQFALSCKLNQNGNYIAKLQKVFVENPIVTVVHHYAVTSGVFGPIAAFIDPKWKLYDEICEKGMIGYANSIPRYGDYGMFIYGNTHHAELVVEHRPTLHRVWRNNHYFHTSTTWELFFRSNSNEMLQLARMFTDNHGSIGQVRYDNKHGYYLGDGSLREGVSETKSHVLGGFWHCKGLVPWGGRDYGMDKNDADAGMYGHWVDSSALLFAWILDADRWAKDGYDLWLDNVVFPTSGTRREANSALVQAMDAYEYKPNPTTLAAIKGLGKKLSSVDITSQRPGPLWHPTWLSRYHEMFPDDADFNKFIVESADKSGTGIEGINNMSLCATAYGMTGDEEYLLRHAGNMDIVKNRLYSDPGGEWDNFGLPPGPGGMDQHFMAQWPRFLHMLHNAKINLMPEVIESANYFNSYCRFNHNGDIASRGSTVLVYQPDGDTSTQITADAITMKGGDIHATSLHVYDPAGQELITDLRMPFKTRYQRPSGWGVRREQYDLQTVPSLSFSIR